MTWRAAVLGTTLAVAAGLVVWAFQRRTLALGSYPVAAAAFLERSGRLAPSHRIAAVDVVGCYLIWRSGPRTKVFIDDRYDMYPGAVVDDARIFGDARSGVESVL